MEKGSPSETTGSEAVVADFKLGVLKNFTRKHLCWSFFLIKLQA